VTFVMVASEEVTFGVPGLGPLKNDGVGVNDGDVHGVLVVDIRFSSFPK